MTSKKKASKDNAAGGVDFRQDERKDLGVYVHLITVEGETRSGYLLSI